MMRFIFIEADTEKELETVRNMFGEVIGDTKKRPMTNAERCKKYRDNKKSVSECVEIVTECNETTQEEKENEEKESTKEKEVKEKEELININAADTKNPKHRYGSGKNVLLTDEEISKLREQFPDADEKIEAMSLYFSSKGNAGKYKSHYHTFLNWERMAKERDSNKQKQSPNEYPDFYSMLQAEGVV